MAKARIGHFVEAQVLEALEVDYIDESEVLTPADEANHIDKWEFKVPFVCGATDLGEALRRIAEGAAMIRTKGEAGTGNVVEAVRHMRAIQSGIRRLGVAGRGRAADGGEGAARAARAGAHGRRRGPPAGRELLRRRHRDARRRRADDAARRRGRVRRLGHLQVRGPARARARDRRRRRRTTRTRRRSPRPRGRWARRWRASTCKELDERQPAPASWLVASRRRRRRPSAAAAPRIGVLAIQGDFEAHAEALERLGAEAVEVRRPEQLDGLDGLVIPGGESTTIAWGSRPTGSSSRSATSPRAGRPVLGTCAGLIMLDRAHSGLMDIEARRNAFGRQVRSFEADVTVRGLGDEPLRAVFIRAPWIERAGDGGGGARRARRPSGRRARAATCSWPPSTPS